ncbi:MAG: AraC family transcriptional regulator [Gammaproteobacteria bacterium]|nr:AraC family transcriptional regulator [Gammaproteobacteria bacterium]MBT8055604.1 AraC family transcriptional regulator [Gammaproteobacteria bacterium]NNJ80052.1 helix-turn-helix domain-containing protein [Xanthomonadales bacterium]
MHQKDQQFVLPAAYLKLFVQYAGATGLDLDPLLQGTGLSVKSLLKAERAIDFETVRRMLARVTRHLGEGWHLALGERFTVPAHGALGFAVVTAPDVRAAVRVLLRYFGIRGPFLWPSGAVEGEEYVIRFYESQTMGAERRLLIELALLSMQGLIERPLGHTLRGARLAFALPKPAYCPALERSFHAELVFDARRHSLRLPLSWLEQPCAMHDGAMHRYLLARCEEELRETAGGLPAELTVRQALLATPGHMPGLGEIAAGQNLSTRTLIRRLKRGGTSYGAIREGVRRTLATDYLANSGLSISRIAYRLGYQDPSNFGRAFRGWFGESPGSYRKNARAR